MLASDMTIEGGSPDATPDDEERQSPAGSRFTDHATTPDHATKNDHATKTDHAAKTDHRTKKAVNSAAARQRDPLTARPAAAADIAALAGRLPDLMLRDRERIGRRLDGLRLAKRPVAPETLARITADIDAAAHRRQRRATTVPVITYPVDLPVSQRKDVIAAAIRDHQVVIVAGETGSGKTTQLPKICLELGRGVAGLIGHTQPRRIAARTVADRIAAELGTELGETIGYQVRFTDQVTSDTLVKVMTDGILLAELQNDRLLNRYDTIIIDEAHERSLNIDFLLGCLRQLLPRRPDLKVVITSATIDPQRFAQHFADAAGTPAPIIEVSGRMYPVEVRYRPLIGEAEDEDDVRDQPQAICDAVAELQAEGPGDILVFCSGEREIRDTAEAIGGMDLRNTEILPLYARLSVAEQHRVFASHTGRRIVLATNVAETSLTVPGIKYVIDPGTARISRYSNRLKVQRLPIEAVSQASANQRAGRCGRTSDGICIRLYSEEDFAGRPAFTEPEILRTNLAGVILQMTAYRLGDITTFPFIDPPDRRNIADGVALLHELGAIGDSRQLPAARLTPLGRQLAALPVDPRMARMVIEADRHACVRDVMVIAAALSIVDPRERPTDKQQAATEKHARFTQPDSDFLSLLHLWAYLQRQQKELSGNQFRKLCRTDFLNYLRVREWQDIYGQLRQAVKSLGITVAPAPKTVDDAPVFDAEKIHQSLLAGLLSHIGMKDLEPKTRGRVEYLGARGARFSIAPGSALFKSQPRWVFAAELVETSRLWGRVAAKIEPEWAESLAAHLVKRNYSEPHWERKQAAVIAYEKVLLYGVPLIAARKVNYGRIDPVQSRDLFIRHALVDGDWDTHHAFFAENRELLDEVEEWEHRARRRDILVSDEDLYAFYDARIPADVVSGRHFDAWWKQIRRTWPDLLSFEKSMLVNSGVRGVDKADYPDALTVDGVALGLTYQFEPGAAADGVTVHVPLPALGGLRAEPFGWQIPGLRVELVTALIKSLPKAIRRSLVPAPDTAAAALDRIGSVPADEPILGALEREFRRMTGAIIDRTDWDLARVPDHLRMTFRVLDENGATLAEGKDLDALKAQLRVQAQAVVAAAADGLERRGLTAWPDTGTAGNAVARVQERRRGGYLITAYPALVDEQTSVALRVFDNAPAADRAMAAGTRRLLLLGLPSPVPAIAKRLSNEAKLVLMRNPSRNVGELLADCVDAATDALVDEFGGPAWDESGFAALRDRVRADLHDATYDTVAKARSVLAGWHAVEARLGSTNNLALAATLSDVRTQVTGLIYPGFVTATGVAHLVDLTRYLRAIERRLERAALDPARDRAQMATVAGVRQEYADWLTELPAGASDWAGVRAVRWMIEELRVNLFAQALGTPYPVSEKRIYRAMDDLVY
jgi:ATP-dependent helicase HrpA